MKRRGHSDATTTFTPADVARIATLAAIPVTDAQQKSLAAGFTTTIEVVNRLFTVDVTDVPPTSQVTGKVNAFRDDEIDVPRMFTQEQALANAKRTYNGYIMVDAVLEEE